MKKKSLFSGKLYTTNMQLIYDLYKPIFNYHFVYVYNKNIKKKQFLRKKSHMLFVTAFKTICHIYSTSRGCFLNL